MRYTMACITFDETTEKVTWKVARTFYHAWMHFGYKCNMYPTDDMMYEPEWDPRKDYVISKSECDGYTIWSITPDENDFLDEYEYEVEELD